MARIQRTQGNPGLHPTDHGLPWDPCSLDCEPSLGSGGRRLEATLDVAFPPNRPLVVRHLDPASPVDRRAVRVVLLDLQREDTDFAGSLELQLAAADLSLVGHRTELVRLTTGFTGARLATSTASLVGWLTRTEVEVLVVRNHVDDGLIAAIRAAGIATIYLDSVVYRGRIPPAGAYDRLQSGDDRVGLLDAVDAFARRGAFPPGGLPPVPPGVPTVPASFLEIDHYWPAVRYREFETGAAVPYRRHLIVHAMGCPYGADAAENPAYAGVSLSGGIKRAGCTYCGLGGDYKKLPVRDYLDFLTSQIAWLAEHAPGAEVVIADEATFGFLDRLVERLAARSVKPGPLLVKARMNGLIPTLDRFEASLRLAQAAGIEVVCYLLGIENFSDAELARYNKGLRAADLVSGLRTLLDLEQRFAGTFSFTRYNAHGFVLYNPWTTVADLEENLTWFRAFGIRRLSGKAIWSRLRMYPWQPLAALAERDGLLDPTDRFATIARVEVGYHGSELGWRFSDPVVELCYSLVSRAMDDVTGVDEVGLELFATALDHARAVGPVSPLPLDRLAAEYSAFRDHHAALFAGGTGLRRARDRVERALAELTRRSPRMAWRVVEAAPQGATWRVRLEGPGGALVGRVPGEVGRIVWEEPGSRAAALVAKAVELVGQSG